MSVNPEDHLDAEAPATPVCAYHADSAASWICTDCQQAFCGACVKTVRLDAGRQVCLCPVCQGLCQPARFKPTSEPEAGYLRGLLRALAYPFRGEALGLLIAVGFLEALTSMLGRALLFSGAVMILGFGLGLYVLVFLRQVLLNAAHGEEASLGWPAWDWDAVKESALEFFVVCLCCFGPWTVWRIWLRPEAGQLWWAGYALLVGGLCYFPMGVLAVVIYDNVAALNPFLVITSILRTLGSYARLCVVLGALAGTVFLLETTLHASGGARLAQAVASFSSTYAAIVAMRCIGWFYRCNKDRLAW